MANDKAQEIITLEERERGKQANFRALWQDTADLMFPRENQIDTIVEEGEEKTNWIFDITAIMESQNMASGLAQNMVPPGQKFFALKAADRDIQDVEDVKRYLSKVTEVMHDELFSSNFMLQLTETLRSLVVFGTGNIFSKFSTKTLKLTYRDYPIGSYQVMLNEDGEVDTMILRYQLTAKQASEEFDGPEGPGKSVEEAMKLPTTQGNKFWFIHVVRPRKLRNLNFTDSLNMPFESLFVSVKDIEIVEEGGFEEFPFHVPRWMKSSSEKYGRGQGTETLPQVRVLNQMMADFYEMGNKINNPPLEVLESFEGEVDMSPKATNFVPERNAIGVVDERALGNYQFGKDNVDLQRQVVKDAFFANAFAPLTNLTGDRRTTLEIRQRVQEAFKKIGSPIGRIYSELFTPQIKRDVMLLLRNGRIPEPPVELQGRDFKVEYVGPLALALRSSEVEASQQWIAAVGAMEEIFPGAADNVDFDDAIRRMARAFGVNEEDISSEEELEEKREARARAAELQQQLQMAQLATQGYGQAVKAPEEGSLAESLVGAGSE